MTPGRYRDITSHAAELKVKSELSGHSRPEIILDKVWVELNKTVDSLHDGGEKLANARPMISFSMYRDRVERGTD